MNINLDLHMGWPEWIVVILMSIEIAARAYIHGQPKTGEWSVFDGLISSAITLALLYWGGFFS